MQDLSTLARVLAVIGDALNKPADDISVVIPLADQGVDGGDQLAITAALEEHFDIELDDIDTKLCAEQLAEQIDAAAAARAANPDTEAL